MYKFLNHQREQELERWMETIGYLYKTAIYQFSLKYP